MNNSITRKIIDKVFIGLKQKFNGNHCSEKVSKRVRCLGAAFTAVFWLFVHFQF